jgi:recombinational DNA repair protein (RecF pathway)
MRSPEPVPVPALWVSSTQLGEADALVRFFTPTEGGVVAKARGLLKAGSKLAPALKPADELSIALAGRARTKTLAGARCTQDHSYWRDNLHRLALVWFMTESAYVGSGTPQLNEQVFQLTVNLLRTLPRDEDLYGAASVFAIRQLSLHGLLPDLDHCCIEHSGLASSEPAFLLPSGEGLVGLAAYNKQYARGRAGLLRLDAARLLRWRSLQRAPLLEYPRSQANLTDAAVLCRLLATQLSNLGNQPLETFKFLKQQWRLPGLGELMRQDPAS